MKLQQSYCTFRLAGQLFGLPVHSVQEILRPLPLTFVPHAPCEVRGVVNVRGVIVLVIDLRRRLGLGPREPDAPHKNVVVRSESGPMALEVDDVADVVDPDRATAQEVPGYVDERARGMIACAYRTPQELLLALKPEVIWRI